MQMRVIIPVLLLCTGFTCVMGAVQTEGWTLDTSGFEFQGKIATATNGLRVEYAGASLQAERGTVNIETGEVVAEGNVRVVREGREWSGERISYNFKTRRILGEDFRSGQLPFLTGGDLLIGDQEAGVYAGGDAFVTTDDVAEPGYRLVAKTLVIIPGEYIEGKHAFLYLGKVPVFYFPRYHRSLGLHPNNFVFVPGYRSDDGPYLLTSYNWYWNKRLDGTLHMDGRLKRGIGFGPDFNWHLDQLGDGGVQAYGIRDDAPGEDFDDQPIDEERGRVYFRHRAQWGSNLVARTLVRYQTDPLLTRDFFETEYRENTQPNSYLEVDKSFRNFNLNFYVQPQVNDFFETVERLPEVKLSGLRQQVGTTPLYYESESSAGYFQRQFADSSTNRYSAARADTFHQLLIPYTAFGWLNLTPRAGGRFTYYTDASGPGETTTEQQRGVFNTGMEASLKASRVWSGVKSGFWQIDGIRHIVEPSLNYVYVPAPNRRPARLPQFDFELPTTRLLPIDYPDYNSIDSIDARNVLRFGVRNKLQTKRDNAVVNVVDWSLVLDWRIDPASGQSTYSDLYSGLDYQPFSWLTLSSDTRYGLSQQRLNEANHWVTFRPAGNWSWSLGHLYLLEVPGQGRRSGNNLLVSTLYYRLNENWGTRASHRFEARDGVMEEQQYSLYRDFRSWTGALTFRVRDERDDSVNYAVAFTFSFKAFPNYGLGDDSVRPSLLLGN